MLLHPRMRRVNLLTQECRRGDSAETLAEKCSDWREDVDDCDRVWRHCSNVFQWALLEREFEVLLALWALYKHNVLLFRACRSLRAANGNDAGNKALVDCAPRALMRDAPPSGFVGECVLPSHWRTSQGGVFASLFDEQNTLPSNRVTLPVRCLAYFLYYLACGTAGSPQECGLVRACYSTLCESLPSAVVLQVLRFEAQPRLSTTPTHGSAQFSDAPTNDEQSILADAARLHNDFPRSPSISAAHNHTVKFNILRCLLGAGKLDCVRVLEHALARAGGHDAYVAVLRNVLLKMSPFDMLTSFDSTFMLTCNETFRYAYQYAGDEWLAAERMSFEAIGVVLHRLLRIGADKAIVETLLSPFSLEKRASIIRHARIDVFAERFLFPSETACEYLNKQIRDAQPPRRATALRAFFRRAALVADTAACFGDEQARQSTSDNRNKIGIDKNGKDCAVVCDFDKSVDQQGLNRGNWAVLRRHSQPALEVAAIIAKMASRD